jgi:hypothetical protein
MLDLALFGPASLLALVVGTYCVHESNVSLLIELKTIFLLCLYYSIFRSSIFSLNSYSFNNE